MALISRHPAEIQALIKRVKREGLMNGPLPILHVPLLKDRSPDIDRCCDAITARFDHLTLHPPHPLTNRRQAGDDLASYAEAIEAYSTALRHHAASNDPAFSTDAGSDGWDHAVSAAKLVPHRHQVAAAAALSILTHQAALVTAFAAAAYRLYTPGDWAYALVTFDNSHRLLGEFQSDFDVSEPAGRLPDPPIASPHADHPVPMVHAPVIEARAPSAEVYEEWVEYCLGLASRRRIPARLVEDLIPSATDADWHVKHLSEFEDVLEQIVPGRRSWLAREGVKRTDFDGFWSKPPWVQNFIEALVERHATIEREAHAGMGESPRDAESAVAAFIPSYSNGLPSDDDLHAPLPLELFERVERYWALLEDDELNRGIVEQHWLSANMRVRSEIQAGRI